MYSILGLNVIPLKNPLATTLNFFIFPSLDLNKILILKMEKSFHEITWNKYKEILYNIVSLVCTNTYFKILHEKYPEIESIIRCI